MRKVLVDPAALEEAAKWLEVHSSSSGSAEAFAADALREAIGQPAEAEGVEVVAYGMPNSAPGKAPRMMMVAIDIPGDDQYGGQLWEPLVRQSALSAVTAERDRLRPIHAMILNALDRDAEEGKTARGEMAAELRAALAAKEAIQ
jgi:hypothetical protein